MLTVELHTYGDDLMAGWSLQRSVAPNHTELVVLPPCAVVDPERDGVELDSKFYSARKVHVLAQCSLRGFRLSGQRHSQRRKIH